VLQDHLRRILEDPEVKDGSGSREELDHESRRRLESLGYVADTRVKEVFDFDQSKKDPKDLIGIYAKKAKVQGLNNLGHVLAAQDRTEEAIQYFSEALRVDPNFADAHNNMGVILLRQGRLGEANRHFFTALKINPEYAEAHNNMGVTLVNMGRVTEAISHFSEAVRINPHYKKAQNNLKSALSRQGRQINDKKP
jgi:tetratricopeptide (TPR) repeat protein